ncbi:N-myristoyltransferase [Salmon gill poxvirus]
MSFWRSFFVPPKQVPDSKLIISDIVTDESCPKKLNNGYSWAEDVLFDDWKNLIKNNYGINKSCLVVYSDQALLYWYNLDSTVFIGISYDGKLIGAISGNIKTIWIDSVPFRGFNIDFLCVAFEHRGKKMAGYMIEEITRYAKNNGIWLGLHTSTKKCTDNVSQSKSYFTSCLTPVPKKNLHKKIRLIQVDSITDMITSTDISNNWLVEDIHLPDSSGYPDVCFYKIMYDNTLNGHVATIPFTVNRRGSKTKVLYVYIIKTNFLKEVLYHLKNIGWERGHDQVNVISGKHQSFGSHWKPLGGTSWLHLYNWSKQDINKKNANDSVFWTY